MHNIRNPRSPVGERGFLTPRDYCLVRHVPHEMSVRGPVIPQRSPELSTHQYAEVVDATAAGRDTATA